MIDKQKSEFVLICDYCGECAAESFETFDDARAYASKNEWDTFMDEKYCEWRNACPECK